MGGGERMWDGGGEHERKQGMGRDWGGGRLRGRTETVALENPRRFVLRSLCQEKQHQWLRLS